MYPVRKRQRGSILTLFVFALFSLLAIGGMAMDFGHVFVGRTSLQNALDAAALSAAKSVNAGKSTVDASADGLLTFNQHLTGVLADKGVAPAFEYSETLVPFVAGAAVPDARYVRSSITNLAIPTTNTKSLPPDGQCAKRPVPSIRPFMNLLGNRLTRGSGMG